MSENNLAISFPPSLINEARRAAESEGLGLDEFVRQAVVEMLAALRTKRHFQERAKRADIAKALDILGRAGVGRAPDEGDELPPRFAKG